MKCLITTFSQTGCTRKTAEQIRQGILVSDGECDLADRSEENPDSPAPDDIMIRQRRRAMKAKDGSSGD